MKIVFMATGDIALPTLRWLLETSEHEVVGLVTQPDRPVGRKQVLTAPAVKALALEHDVPVLQPEKIREAKDELVDWQADLHVVMAFGQILPQSVIDIAPRGIINLHASLLPKYRGASCIQGAIANGDAETGITVMHVVKKLDAGDIIAKVATPVDEKETGGELHDRLAEMGPEALELALAEIEKGTPAEPQDELEMTYAPKLLREHGEIDWGQSAPEIERLVRAYHPWPGTYGISGGKRVKVFPPVAVDLQSELGEGEVSVVEGQVFVGCGAGAIVLTEIQPEGKRRMAAADFVRGATLDFQS